jgi:hypothetical protein
VSERVLDPPHIIDIAVLPYPITPKTEYKFADIFVIIMFPDRVFAASKLAADSIKKPADIEDEPTPAPPPVAEPEYPVISNPPESPIWICTADVPLVLTPLNITVTRFTHDGMLVKSMLVPEVDA